MHTYHYRIYSYIPIYQLLLSGGVTESLITGSLTPPESKYVGTIIVLSELWDSLYYRTMVLKY